MKEAQKNTPVEAGTAPDYCPNVLLQTNCNKIVETTVLPILELRKNKHFASK
jgi:hypothetical protein